MSRSITLNRVHNAVFQLAEGVQFIDDGEALFCQVKRGTCLTRFKINKAIQSYLLQFTHPRRVGDVIAEQLRVKPDVHDENELLKFTRGLLQTPLLADCGIDHQMALRILHKKFPGSSVDVLKQRELDGVFLLKNSNPKQSTIVKLAWHKDSELIKPRIARKLENEQRHLHILAPFHISPKVGTLCQDDDSVLFTMEFIAGTPLTTLQLSDTPLHQRLAICAQVISHFATIHDAGILHGDVHTSNVLCADDYQIKIIDFDCSHPKNQQPEGRIGGAPHFFPPERVCEFWHSGRQAPSTERGEIYQVALIVHKILMGKLPFRGQTYHTLMQSIKHGYGQAQSEQIAQSDLPERIGIWLQQCLATNPLDRPARLRDTISAWSSYV